MTVMGLLRRWLAVQERLRHAGGVELLVALLGGGQGAAAAQRALLAVRLLTDREPDRAAIMASPGLLQATLWAPSYLPKLPHLRQNHGWHVPSGHNKFLCSH